MNENKKKINRGNENKWEIEWKQECSVWDK